MTPTRLPPAHLAVAPHRLCNESLQRVAATSRCRSIGHAAPQGPAGTSALWKFHSGWQRMVEEAQPVAAQDALDVSRGIAVLREGPRELAQVGNRIECFGGGLDAETT